MGTLNVLGADTNQNAVKVWLWMNRPLRVGLLGGTFDPVHKGHITFALQAIEMAGLDEVVFLPETLPRYKKDVTHVTHRVAMLKAALKPYPKLKVELLPNKKFVFATSMPRIRKLYPDAALNMLIGTDVLSHISVWPSAKQYIKDLGLVVAVRGEKDERHAHQLLASLPVEPKESHVLVSNHKFLASRDLRAELRKGNTPEGTLKTVSSYAKKNWLYESVASEKSS